MDDPKRAMVARSGRRGGRWRRALLAAAAALTLAGWAGDSAAQGSRPEGTRRLVKRWTFDERDRHLEPVPQDWFRAQDNGVDRRRPGFPAWNQAVLSDESAAEGRWSVKLPTRGGSTSLMLARGVLPAMPDGDYLIAFNARTTGLTHARAVVRARLLDGTGDRAVIPGSDRQSEPLINDGTWQLVQFGLPGHPDAAFMQIELDLLQPDQLLGREKLAQESTLQDFTGAAWFDDLRVFQVPRVMLSTTDPGNMATGPELPRVELRVRDLTGETLAADLRVYAIDGREVDSAQVEVAANGRPAGFTPRLPAYGWYRAALRLTSKSTGAGVAATKTDFVWMPPLRPFDRSLSGRFGLVLGPTPEERFADLPDIAARSLSGSLSMVVWSAQGSAAVKPAAELVEGTSRPRVPPLFTAVETLLERGTDLTFVLSAVPPELARESRVDGAEPFDLVGGEPAKWLPALEPLLTRFGERVRRWQVGATGSSTAFWRPRLASELEAFRAGLYRLVPRPIAAVPWSVEQRVPAWAAGGGASAMALTVVLPHGAPAESIPLYAQQWPAGADVTLVVEPPPAAVFGLDATVAELTRRAVLAWAAGVPRIAAPQPWSWTPGGSHGPSAMPSPEFAVWRNLIQELAAAKYLGEMPMPDGARAILAEGPEGGLLIAWNNYADPERAVVRGYLGSGAVTVVDAFGNRRPAPASASGGAGYEIALAPTPVFIHGVDASLARFRGRVRLDPAFLPARSERHNADIVLENPWPIAVSGRLRVAEPAEWAISPRVASFSLSPGETARIPVSIVFGVAEDAGHRSMTVEMELSADRQYPLLRMSVPVEIGLDTVQMQPSLRFVPDDRGELRDAMVTVLITNLGTAPLSMEALAQAPGYAGQQAPVSDLKPGQSAIRRFRFENAAERLRGKPIRVGLREQNGTGRLNRTLVVP
ncbi:MAG: hypothetical protein IBJ11_07405 [Phycisphaerales bacterium]|nr:hypothetical protein [Phycisphaerales bacterium]